MDEFSLAQESTYQVLKTADEIVATELVRLALIRAAQFVGTVTVITILVRLARRHQS